MQEKEKRGRIVRNGCALALVCVKAMGDGDYQFLMRMMVVVMNERSESQVEIWRMLLPLLVDWLLFTSLGWT